MISLAPATLAKHLFEYVIRLPPTVPQTGCHCSVQKSLGAGGGESAIVAEIGNNPASIAIVGKNLHIAFSPWDAVDTSAPRNFTRP